MEGEYACPIWPCHGFPKAVLPLFHVQRALKMGKYLLSCFFFLSPLASHRHCLLLFVILSLLLFSMYASALIFETGQMKKVEHKVGG